MFDSIDARDGADDFLPELDGGADANESDAVTPPLLDEFLRAQRSESPVDIDRRVLQARAKAAGLEDFLNGTSAADTGRSIE